MDKPRVHERERVKCKKEININWAHTTCHLNILIDAFSYIPEDTFVQEKGKRKKIGKKLITNDIFGIHCYETWNFEFWIYKKRLMLNQLIDHPKITLGENETWKSSSKPGAAQ